MQLRHSLVNVYVLINPYNPMHTSHIEKHITLEAHSLEGPPTSFHSSSVFVCDLIILSKEASAGALRRVRAAQELTNFICEPQSQHVGS